MHPMASWLLETKLGRLLLCYLSGYKKTGSKPLVKQIFFFFLG